MKIKNIKDVPAFFDVIEHCSGDVFLVTEEGDKLNLKSKLCQVVALAGVFSLQEIPEMDLIADDSEDAKKLIDFIGKQ